MRALAQFRRIRVELLSAGAICVLVTSCSRSAEFEHRNLPSPSYSADVGLLNRALADLVASGLTTRGTAGDSFRVFLDPYAELGKRATRPQHPRPWLAEVVRSGIADAACDIDGVTKCPRYNLARFIFIGVPTLHGDTIVVPVGVATDFSRMRRTEKRSWQGWPVYLQSVGGKWEVVGRGLFESVN